jgi:hypothetical protein
MRTGNVLLAGAAAAVVAAGTAAYAASRPAVHHLTVNVPGVGVERIDYTGDVAPKVVMLRSPSDAAWDASPFAMMDRIAAQMDAMNRAMDRQMAASFGALQNFALHPDNPAILASLPSGAQGTAGYCARSVTITAMANGARPQVVSHTYGNCGGATDASPAATPGTDAVLPPEGRHSI